MNIPNLASLRDRIELTDAIKRSRLALLHRSACWYSSANGEDHGLQRSSCRKRLDRA